MMKTIKDVAQEANVSISTVSRVLNNSGYTSEETRKKVIEAVEKLNFKRNMIAAAMIKKKTSTFGLIIPDIKNVFYADLTRAVEDTANKYGFNILLCNTDNDLSKEAEYIDLLIAKGVDGIIFSTPEVKDMNIKNVVDAHPELPVVILGSKLPNVHANEILVDNFEGAYLATTHLIDMGHKEIAFLTGGRDSSASIERHKGFRFAMSERGLEVNSHFVCFDKYYIESGYINALKLLTSKRKPTAIFAGSDAIAVGIYKAARELKLTIPDELSVIGFDDSQYAEILAPNLTTIHTPIGEMGERAIEVAVKMINKKKNAKETLLFHPTLKVRESTKSLF